MMEFLPIEQALAQASLLTLFTVTVLYWLGLALGQAQPLLVVAKAGMAVASLCMLATLLLRWLHSGHLPLGNLYESLLFLAWTLMSVHPLLSPRIQSNWLGAITAPSALLIQGFATLGLPERIQQVSALVPALQSNWLVMHVSMMVLSYGALLFGAVLAVTELVIHSRARSRPRLWADLFASLRMIWTDELAELCLYETRKVTLLAQLDYWSYRAIGIGFPLLTIGILSGAVWANEAWGSYWSWDPKETWALITWLIFAVYLHTRISKGWAGTKPALVASAGLGVVWACYIGVNLLGRGLHSYGWLD